MKEYGPINTKDGIVGVASVAGIASRNGRVSSIGGIKFFPSMESVSSKDQRYYYPLTVSAEKDGRYASGTVQVLPGYVSTSARAGYAPPNQKNPFQNDMFFQFQPQDMFNRNLESWFPKDMFQNFSPQPDVLRNGWFYPSFNPFVNFWR